MTVETKVQLTENEVYLVTTGAEENRGYTYNRRNGEHVFSRKIGSVPFMRQIFVKACEGDLEIEDNYTPIKNALGEVIPRKVKINGEYLVGAISDSINPLEYSRLLEIWRNKRHDSQ